MTNKKRLIDANALMEQVKAIHKAVDTSAINTDYDTGFHSATSQVQGLIAYMQTVDAVDVVRCRDCKLYSNYDMENHKRLKFHWCRKFNNITKEDDFCSYGERRKNADD